MPRASNSTARARSGRCGSVRATSCATTASSAVEHRRGEQVQRRVVQDDDGDVAVPLEPDGRGCGHARSCTGPTPVSRAGSAGGPAPAAAAEDVEVDVVDACPACGPVLVTTR